MDNIYDLVNNLKRLSVGANKAENSQLSVEFGEVKKVDPLVIDMGQFTIEDDLIAISGYVKWKQGLSQSNDLRLKVGDAIILLNTGGELWIALDTVEVED